MRQLTYPHTFIFFFFVKEKPSERSWKCTIRFYIPIGPWREKEFRIHLIVSIGRCREHPALLFSLKEKSELSNCCLRIQRKLATRITEKKRDEAQCYSNHRGTVSLSRSESHASFRKATSTDIYLYTKEFFFTLPFSLMRCLQGAEPMNLLFYLIPQEFFRLSLARTSPLDALYGANHFKKKKPQLYNTCIYII